MNYSTHPYASTSAQTVATNSPLRRTNAKTQRPKRPSIQTSCTASSSKKCSIDILPDLSEEDYEMSPITFLDVGEAINKQNARRTSRRRPVGLTGLEHFKLETYLRDAPRAPSPRSPVAVDVKSPTESVTLTFDGLSLDFPTPPIHFSTHSPASTAKSLDTSTSPSTPALPLTPASSDEDEFLQSVAPLSISKPSNVNKTSTSSRTSTRSAVARVFAPLDTVAANNLDLGLDLSLTGMLEEIRRSQCLPTPPPLPEAPKVEKKGESVEDDDNDEDWVDWTPEDDAIAARDYYRSDIATHLQLFSPPAFTNPFAAPSSAQRPGHRRFPSSLSSTQQFPPARPDSLPPPPQLLAGPSATPINASFFRRSSATSLASTVSARSNRSVRSNASRASTARFSVNSLTGRRVSARAARSARMGIQHGRRRSSTGSTDGGKPLPPTPTSASITSPDVTNPCPLLDPSFPRNFIPTRPPPPVPTKANASISERRRTRPPPRSSLPVDVDFAFDEPSSESAIPEGGLRVTLDGVVEEDEEDPFLPVFVEIGGVSEAPKKLPELKLELNKDITPAQKDIPLSPFSNNSQCLSPVPESEGEERVLRSRWSTSTLGSLAAPQTASSARSVFAKLQNFTMKKSPKKRESASNSPAQQQQQQQPVARPFPFFPTPSPPSPTKKRTPGPGPYVPKPAYSPSSSTTTSSPSPRSSTSSTRTPASPSPPLSSKHRASPSYSEQYAQYAAFKANVSTPPKPPSPTPSARSLSSFAFSFPSSGSSNASSSGSSCGGHGARFQPMSPSPSPGRKVRRQLSQVSRTSFASDRTTESSDSSSSSGLRRKPIPVEIFMRC